MVTSGKNHRREPCGVSRAGGVGGVGGVGGAGGVSVESVGGDW
jgi:hypothetical protein